MLKRFLGLLDVLLARDYLEIAHTIWSKGMRHFNENYQAKLALANSVTQESTNFSQTQKNLAGITC